jgi:hypothetical protein
MQDWVSVGLTTVKPDAHVAVEEGGQALEDGVGDVLGDGGDDHHQHVVLVEHEVGVVGAVAALAGEVVEHGPAADAGALQQVQHEVLLLALDDDLQLLQSGCA